MTAVAQPAGGQSGVRPGAVWRHVVGAVLIVLGASVGVGWVMRLVGGRGPMGPDRAVTDWFVARRSSGLTDALRVAQPTGRGWVLLVIGVIGVGLLLLRRHRRTGGFLVVAMLGAELIVDVAKVVVGRHRPPVALHLEAIGNGAFPSGHAFNTTVVVGALLVALWHIRARAIPWWGWALVALVPLVVGLTRVYLGVHWITDVIAGWFLGALWVLLLARAFFPTPAIRMTPRVTREP